MELGAELDAESNAVGIVRAPIERRPGIGVANRRGVVDVCVSLAQTSKTRADTTAGDGLLIVVSEIPGVLLWPETNLDV
jgi:hypothetical protein